MLKAVRKTIGFIVSVVLIVIVLAVVGIHFFAGRALKLGIEKIASRTLNVDVTVDEVSLSLMRGSLRLEDLKIGNPEGYQYDNLIELGNATVDLDFKSLLSDTVVIKAINLDKVSLVIEQKELVHNNLHEILKSLPSPDKQDAEPDKSAKKLHIDHLSVTDTTVKAKLLPVPGRADTVELTLAPIEMSDLGKDNKLTTPILIAKVLTAIAAGVAEKGGGLLPDDMIGSVRSVLETSGKVITEKGKEILQKGAEAGKELQKTVTEGIKGLLPGKKD
jgi:hypothetical protein